MKSLITFLLVVLISSVTFAQTFQVPYGYSLILDEDYAKYEKDVLACVTWLENTPTNHEEEKRKAASAFFVQWITGSPTVNIEIKSYLSSYAESYPALLIVFMGGYTRYVIENPKQPNEPLMGNLAGVRSMLKLYSVENGNMKSKELDKLKKLDQKGGLQKWVEGKIK